MVYILVPKEVSTKLVLGTSGDLSPRLTVLGLAIAIKASAAICENVWSVKSCVSSLISCICHSCFSGDVCGSYPALNSIQGTRAVPVVFAI